MFKYCDKNITFVKILILKKTKSKIKQIIWYLFCV